MDFHVDLDWDEAFEYRTGQTVELKSNPGTFSTIESYEVTMVPPIWLENDPCPRYPHELRVVTPSEVEIDFPRECLLPAQR